MMTRREFIKNSVRLLAGAIAVDSLWYEREFIKFQEHFVIKQGLSSIRLKFVQLSDLHLHSLHAGLIEAASKVNRLNPDFIVLTGDSIDNKDHLPVLNKFLGHLDKNVQKMAILGNWEHWGHVDIGTLKGVYAIHNCDLLINGSKLYQIQGKKILISGVDDFVGGAADFSKAVQANVPNDYHILLNHCPGYRDLVCQLPGNEKVDLILAGHTHGGQINVGGFIPIVPPGSGPYVKGWYKEKHPPMYVSVGIGTSGIPLRFGVRAQIDVFHLNA